MSPEIHQPYRVVIDLLQRGRLCAETRSFETRQQAIRWEAARVTELKRRSDELHLSDITSVLLTPIWDDEPIPPMEQAQGVRWAREALEHVGSLLPRAPD